MKKKPKLKKLPKFQNAGEYNSADPYRKSTGVYQSNGKWNTDNNLSYGDAQRAGSFATQSAIGINQAQHGPGTDNQKAANSANAVVDSYITNFTPWGAYAMQAQKMGKSMLSTKTATDPETGETITTGADDVNRIAYDWMTPTHTQVLTDIGNKDYGKAAEHVFLNKGITDLWDHSDNDKYNEIKTKEDAFNKKQQDQQNIQNQQYNDMYNYYLQSKNQNTMVAKYGGKKPKFNSFPMPPHLYQMGGVNNGIPNAELENQETYQQPDGTIGNVNGPSHDEGGVDINIPDGTQILSDKLKMPGTKKTFAKLGLKYTTKKEDKVLGDGNTSSSKKTSAELMKQVKNIKHNELFNIQENLKHQKVEDYAKKLGVDINSLNQPQQEQTYAGGGKHWIQGAINPKHKGYCSPMTKSTCTPHRKALAMTFKKHHGFHENGGVQLPKYQYAGETPQSPLNIPEEEKVDSSKYPMDDFLIRPGMNGLYDNRTPEYEPIRSDTPPFAYQSKIVNFGDVDNSDQYVKNPDYNHTYFTTKVESPIVPENYKKPTDPDRKPPRQYNWNEIGNNAGDIMSGLGNSIGPAWDLYKTNFGKKYDKENYGQVNPQLLNNSQALQTERENYLANKKDIREIGQGNTAQIMSNYIRNKSKSTMDRANIIEQYQNQNATISNDSLWKNKELKLRAIEATEQNKARAEDIASRAINKLGSNSSNAWRDRKATGMDQQSLAMIGAMYKNYVYKNGVWIHRTKGTDLNKDIKNGTVDYTEK